MQLTIVGTGYVGLVTGVCFAEMGHRVLCLDTDEYKISQLKEGVIPFYEPGLKELVERNVTAGRLSFSTDYAEATKQSSVCFLALPTPSKPDGSCDLTCVFNAVEEIACRMEKDHVIVIKSTVPVGTAQQIKKRIQQILSEKGLDLHCDVISNPEFLKEGAALADFMKPDRVILGVDNISAEKLMREIYAAFTFNTDRIFVMDTASAEMTKYTANAMLAARISFMNEIASLCEKLGADIHQVRIGIGSDQRIGTKFLYAGAGFGGSCFPKDLRALQAMGASVGAPMPLLAAIEQVNVRQKELMGTKIIHYFASRGGMKRKTIAIWGIAFKPDTDDIREAPALTLIDQLIQEGAQLRIYDPIAMTNGKKHLKHPEITWCRDEYEAALGADAITLMTEWRQFRFVNFPVVKEHMSGKALFDGRNQYRSQEMQALGFDYFGIGVSSSEQEIALPV